MCVVCPDSQGFWNLKKLCFVPGKMCFPENCAVPRKSVFPRKSAVQSVCHLCNIVFTGCVCFLNGFTLNCVQFLCPEPKFQFSPETELGTVPGLCSDLG